jgi:CRP/FNR family cyclic AMP-dependent transcriptional regulator
LLREIPLFSDLSADDLVQVAQTAGERWFEDGQIICRQNETGEELFVIASGEVRVTKLEQGQERQLAVRKAGEFIGEMSIIESAPRYAMVTAIGDVRTLVINTAAFKDILLERPEVAMAVMRGLSHRLRERR